MKRKDVHQSKPVGNQVGYPNRTSLSLNNGKRRNGYDFPGNCSQAQRSPSEYLRTPLNQGNKSEISLKFHQISSQSLATGRK